MQMFIEHGETTNRGMWKADALDLVGTSPHMADGKPVMIDINRMM